MSELSNGNSDIYGKIIVPIISSIISIITIFLTYQFYKLKIKYKNKTLKLRNRRIEILKIILAVAIIYPIYIYIIQIEVYKRLNKSIALNISIILIWILFSIFCWGYMKASIRDYEESQNKSKIKKIYKNYVQPSIIFILCILFSRVICLISIDITEIVLEKITLDVNDYITTYMTTYLVSIIIVWGFYISEKFDLIKRVKEVKVFYSQNGELKVAYGIDYKDFDIDKDFITFYSKKEKCRSVILAKDLVKIQYHY